jgi:hypothetical protein
MVRAIGMEWSARAEGDDKKGSDHAASARGDYDNGPTFIHFRRHRG